MYTELEKHHGVFSCFWSLTKPIFTNKIPTACVEFNKVGKCINMKINPGFWEELDQTQRMFIVSHECLHVILEHGKRGKGLNKKVANIAMDIVINESLVSRFGFDKDHIDPLVDGNRQFVWLDVISEMIEKPLLEGQPFEYYYNKIIESGKELPFTINHDGLESFGDMDISDFEELAGEIEKLENFMKQAGVDAGNLWRLAVARPVKKKKWETVIKDWVRANLDREVNWRNRPRRMENLPPRFFLPSENNDEEKQKINVWFFQDTSGSCVHWADRFFNAALSIPDDRFNVRMFCFDTKVYETSLESKKLYGFGGTSFDCIDQYVRQNKHPDVIFVITDGYGDRFKPEKAKRWNFFVDGTFEYVPDGVHKWNLKDFE